MRVRYFPIILISLMLFPVYPISAYTCDEPGADGSEVKDGYSFFEAEINSPAYGKCNVTCKYKSDANDIWTYNYETNIGQRKSCRFIMKKISDKLCQSNSVDDCVFTSYSKPE